MPEAATSTLHPLVQEAVHSFLALADREAPGLIEGLYLTGSVALGDFRPDESDVDFVAMTRGRADAVAVARLERIHDKLRARRRLPRLEGVFVTWTDLALDPAHVEPAPCWHVDRLQAVDCSKLTPVTWRELGQGSLTIRGPASSALTVWHDPAVLAAWTRRNLQTYWREWHTQSSRLRSRAGLAMLGTWAPAWGVLGVSRLHFTLTSGDITSKEGAGLHARSLYPARWHRIVEECLRIRRGERGRSLYWSPLARRRDALDFLAMVLDAAPRA